MDEHLQGGEPAGSGLRIRGRIERVPELPHRRQARADVVIAEPQTIADRLAADRNRATGESETPTEPKPRGRPKGSKNRPPAFPDAGDASGNPGEGLTPDDGKTVRGGRVDPHAAERAKSLFHEIGARFNENRKKSKATAYERYQHDLMENMDTLVLGGVMDLKDINTTITNLEQYMRDNTGDQGKSQAQLLAEWLRIPAEEILS